MSLKYPLLNSYLQLHFLVIIWGFTAILGKLISLDATEIVFYRTLIASVLLFFIVKLRRRELRFDADSGKMMLTGFIIAVHWTLFFLSAQIANISICLAGIATASFWTSILEPILTKRKFRLFEPILGIVAVIGISVVFDAVFDQYIGFLIAVASAMLASTFTVLNGKMVKKNDHYVISFYQMLGAFICTVLILVFSHLSAPNYPIDLIPEDWDVLWLAILALICTVYAYTISIKLMHRLSAFVINLTINLEPVYGILLALLIFGDSEFMGNSFYIGTGIILLSVLMYPLLSMIDRKFPELKLK